jgi:hypothetical protein
VFDGCFKLLCDKELSLPLNDDMFELDRFKVDDDGNVYISGRQYEGVKDRYKSIYTYKLYAYKNKGVDQSDYSFNLGDKKPTDLQFAINDNGDISVSGFYTDKAKGDNSIRGCFYGLINAESKKLMSSSTKEFDINFITQYMSERKEEKARKKEAQGDKQEMANYDLHEIVLRSDGGAILVAEQYYIRTVTTYTPGANGMGGSYHTSYYYDYNDILVVNITPQGNIEWMQKIHKKQESNKPASETYTSYAIAVAGSAIHFIYNDYAENLLLGEKDDYKQFRSVTKNTAVVLATIDKTGSVKREMLFDRSDTELYTKPFACEQTDDRTFIVFAERKDNHQFAKIIFK